ncbi:hypothetical protein BDV93DRAFT_512565 [Ceratobasidium sp. AG-I]|nr:hypothetical protein BDV93DRAFT_512565 [Ceratobasidium sp. AG-I]
MSSAGINQYPDPPHKRAAIEAWISTVSNHPPSSAMASPLGFLDSDNEGITVPRSRVVIPQQPGVVRPYKQSRANSSPLADHMRVYQDRSATPYAPPSTRDPSPAPTEDTQAESTSSGHSELDSNVTDTGATKHRDKTALKRNFMDPKVELVQCIERIRKSDSPAYLNYHDPTVIEPRTGRTTHNRFKCKHCNQIVERPIGVSYTLNLSSHSKKCAATTKQSQSLVRQRKTSVQIYPQLANGVCNILLHSWVVNLGKFAKIRPGK